MEDECPGAGKCHGCAKWCDWCGDDAKATCDAPRCDSHRCFLCATLLTEPEHEEAFDAGGYPTFCFACQVKVAMSQAMLLGADEAAAGEAVHQRLQKYL